MELIQGADRSKWMVKSNHSIKCFTTYEVDRMTRNYITTLGRGGFGEVYEGVLEDQIKVAVKRFINNAKVDFAKELAVHREINHRNVVRLIGYCVDENALMMITEYIANGNLSDVLHQDSCPIPLDTRLRIAIECAEALAYMHSHMYTRVIHGDIKPSNILLDDNFHAKLSDFGISRLVDTDKAMYTENVIGSIGYMDPLFAQDGLLTSKSDVYSFGIVLLELISRKKATTVVDNVNLVRAFTNALARGVRGAREIFDGEITACKNSMKIVEEFAKIAGECLAMERDKRPEMIDVVERLRVLKNASHQDQGERAGLFSWARKSKPVTAAGVTTVPANILILPAHLCRQFSFAEMKAATNNFYWRLRVRDGAFGSVYRGKIDGGKTEVAIKRHNPHSVHGSEEFRTEIEMSSKVRHCNVAQLIGYCDEMDEMILVYDYMARGCLRDHLYRTKLPPLTWNRRLEICIGAARGLHCLHASQVIYRNLKTEHILLDDAWAAKLTDLALCKTAGPSMDETTRVIGCGNVLLDHEYVTTGRLTEKLDVYSFGGVLLQVLCARPILDISLPKEEMNLVDWALHCKEAGKLDQIVDPYLMGRINLWSLNKFSETAFKCLAPQGIDRPSMGDVISDLEHALHWQGSADASECAKSLPSHLCRQFWLAEMEAATNNFDKSLLIGSGLFDRVYLGKIDGVAITLVDVTHVYSVCAFRSLIEITSKLCHGHLVTLIGYCDEQEMMLLIYEYVTGGYLSEHLYGTRRPPLHWIQRMKICIGVARGLCYLHALQLTHGAVRTSNIVLDDECLSKITNLAPPSNLLDTHATEVCEADGYIDPEYLRTGLHTEKSDVYCFGLLLLEVLFGRPVTKYQRLEEQGQWPTSDYLDQNIDPFLREKIKTDSLYKFFQTAVKCLADKGVDRPTMEDVLWNVEYALELNREPESGDNGGYISDDAMDEGR